MFTVSFESTDLRSGLTALPGRLLTAVSRAINGTLIGARGVMAARISGETGIPALIIEKSMKVYPSTPDHLSGQLSARTREASKRIPILQLRARQVGRGPTVPGGVTFQLAGQTGTLPNSFIATMRGSGHRGVFTRRGRRRLPILEEKGPAVRSLFEVNEAPVRDWAERDVAERLERELQVVAARV